MFDSYISNSPKKIPTNKKKITNEMTYGLFAGDMLYSSMEIQME
jgi:hypothetical protein